jgi:hypothetical protein
LQTLLPKKILKSLVSASIQIHQIKKTIEINPRKGKTKCIFNEEVGALQALAGVPVLSIFASEYFHSSFTT